MENRGKQDMEKGIHMISNVFRFVFITFVLGNLYPLCTVSAVEVSYITARGDAYKMDTPDQRLKIGDTLAENDIIELANSAGIRLLFNIDDVSISKVFRADGIIDMGEVISGLNNSSDAGGGIVNEGVKLYKKYFNPEYNKTGAVKAVSSFDHKIIISHKQKPSLPNRKGKADKQFFLSGREMDIPLVECQNLNTFDYPKDGEPLDFGATCTFRYKDHSDGKMLYVLSESDAGKIDDALAHIKKEAIDEFEYVKAASMFLSLNGIWCEALHLIDQYIIKTSKILKENGCPDRDFDLFEKHQASLTGLVQYINMTGPYVGLMSSCRFTSQLDNGNLTFIRFNQNQGDGPSVLISNNSGKDKFVYVLSSDGNGKKALLKIKEQYCYRLKPNSNDHELNLILSSMLMENRVLTIYELDQNLSKGIIDEILNNLQEQSLIGIDNFQQYANVVHRPSR